MSNLYRIREGKLGHVLKKKFTIESRQGREYDKHKGTGYLTGNENGFETREKGGENMKKPWICLAGIFLAAACLSGCQQKDPKPGDVAGYDPGEEYLSIWVHSIEDTEEGQAYRESVESFNEAFDGKYFADIEFVPRNDSGGGYSDKVNASVMSGGLPDVLTVDGPNVSAYAANGIIQLLGLEEYRYRKPKNLSGGQRQRVALGRAIVKNQKVFLMDEPLSNLDAKLRVSMRTEISKLHRQLGATTIYVTHDQVEAMTMADRIVIMKDGVIQQVGKPMELYDHPKNQFVAGFIGSPQMNFFDVKVEGNLAKFKDGNTLALSEATVNKLKGRQGEMILGIRGEDIKLDEQNLGLNQENHMSAVITDTEVMGNENNLYFEFGGAQAVARVSKYEVSQIGDTIDFVFMPSKIHFFDKDTGVNYTEEA